MSTSRLPRFLRTSLVIVAVAWCATPAGLAGGADLQPANLRCEYRVRPTGLDVMSPRLSWEFEVPPPGARGLQQSAYHILVASSPDRLRPGAADLWDSGEVHSDQTLHIPYAGRELVSCLKAHWTVRVRGADGWSEWAKSEWWTMGLLHPGDWAGLWIGTGERFTRKEGWPPPDSAPPDPWFRRTWVVPGEVRRAVAHVASVGYHELWVNGRKVGGAVLVPSVTDHSRRARYLAYELADYLHPGTNVLGLWLGTGWSIFPKFARPDRPQAPLVRAEFQVEDSGGKVHRVRTGPDWVWRASPSRLLGVWDFMHFGGEEYDANRELAGWAEAGLDESGWAPVQVFEPSLVLSADPVEPNRVVAESELEPREVKETEPGVWRVDFGRNVAGFVELGIEGGQPGDRVEMQFSEQEKERMTHRLRSVYVVGPSGKGVFRNRFNYAVGRWMTVTGLRVRPVFARAWLVRPAYDGRTDFECSNRWLNQVHETARWTFENLSLGGYLVDCPHRERMGYGGDGHATTTMGLLQYRLGALYTKWAEDWRDVQGRGSAWGSGASAAEGALEPGNLPYTAPTYWGGGGPGWGGYVVHLPAEMWRAYGDRRLIEQMLPTIEAWLGFLETKSKDDLLRRWGGEWDFLGDWLWPGAKGVNGDTRETLFFNNAYWIYNLDTASRLARVVGKEGLAERWAARAAAVRRAAHAEFYHAADASYVGGGQAYMALAIVAGVPPADQLPAVWRRLEREIVEVRQGSIHAGITGGAFLFKALMEARRDDLLLPMVAHEEYPGWIPMLRSGATTFWESWEDNPALSYLHSSYLYVGAWVVERGLGIQPLEPGFSRFRISPPLVDPARLGWARGGIDTVRGRIEVEWARRGSEFELAVVVPPNTRALVATPCRPESLGIEEERIAREQGVRVAGREGGRLLIETGSGAYRFRTPVD